MCLFTHICIFKISIISFHVSLNSKSCWCCLVFGLKQLLLYSLILPLPDLEQRLAARKETTTDVMQLSLELPVGSSQNSFFFMLKSQFQIYPNWNLKQLISYQWFSVASYLSGTVSNACMAAGSLVVSAAVLGVVKRDTSVGLICHSHRRACDMLFFSASIGHPTSCATLKFAVL